MRRAPPSYEQKRKYKTKYYLGFVPKDPFCAVAVFRKNRADIFVRRRVRWLKFFICFDLECFKPSGTRLCISGGLQHV